MGKTVIALTLMITSTVVLYMITHTGTIVVVLP
jgi:hypothetical protein